MGIVTQVHMKNKEIIKKGDKKEKKEKPNKKCQKTSLYLGSAHKTKEKQNENIRQQHEQHKLKQITPKKPFLFSLLAFFSLFFWPPLPPCVMLIKDEQKKRIVKRALRDNILACEKLCLQKL